MLIRNITKRLEIPDEADQWAIIRRLTWKQLERAADVRSDKATEKMKAAGSDMLRTIRELTPAVPFGTTPAKAPDPFVNYDLETVLRSGVANLSYVQPFTDDVVLDLDRATAEFLAREILIFSGVGETAADAKNA